MAGGGQSLPLPEKALYRRRQVESLLYGRFAKAQIGQVWPGCSAKQHSWLADSGVLRYQAVVRHWHLVDAAYVCLTHVGLKAQRAQEGHHDSKTVLPLGPIGQLKNRMPRIIWQEAVKDVAKHSHEKSGIRRLEKLLAA